MHFWKKEKTVLFLSRNAFIFPYFYHGFFFFCLFVCFIFSVEGRVLEEASDSDIILGIKSRIIIQSRARCKFRELYDA